MHRISVSSDAPALVLAVPGRGQAKADVADRIAESAAESCAGADIKIGYLSGTTDSLGLILAAATSGRHQNGHDGRDAYPGGGYPRGGHARRALRELFKHDKDRPGDEPRAVVVPLLAGPHPTLDPAIAAAVRSAQPAVMLAAALGPHPLLAGALHDRLSEAGLARASRARGLNISAGATGIIVVADRGPQAIADAGVTAVLLAARLAVPVAPASLGDPASIAAAVQRLREAGAARLAIAPCVIGPETDPADFAALTADLRAPCSAPLGDHPAIAQLVAVRYGEALTRISAASR